MINGLWKDLRTEAVTKNIYLMVVPKKRGGGVAIPDIGEEKNIFVHFN